jgi:bile acid:Na+ symporter, BASS family
MTELDQVMLNFNEGNVFIVNLSLSLIMFGVALNLRLSDFYLVFIQPKAAILGFASQFLLLPALTFLLVWLFRPQPGIALGLMLVAACPGGNISNFMTAFARGNAALSVCMTAVASVVAVFMTPFNLAFWGSLYPPAAELLRQIHLDFFELVRIVSIILVIPMVLGMVTRAYLPRMADLLYPKLHFVSIAIFAGIVAAAFYANFHLFIKYIGAVALLVFLHNALAISSGFGLAKLGKLSGPDRRTIAIETGIQNSGLGLGLIFTFFNGLGSMAIVAGWWGIWHIISGLGVGYFWRKFP